MHGYHTVVNIHMQWLGGLRRSAALSHASYENIVYWNKHKTDQKYLRQYDHKHFKTIAVITPLVYQILKVF